MYWRGKPIAVIVSEHRTGGKGVLLRLQGVLVTFGALIPPMSGMVYSLAGQNAVETDSPGRNDVWCLAGKVLRPLLAYGQVNRGCIRGAKPDEPGQYRALHGFMEGEGILVDG